MMWKQLLRWTLEKAGTSFIQRKAWSLSLVISQSKYTWGMILAFVASMFLGMNGCVGRIHKSLFRKLLGSSAVMLQDFLRMKKAQWKENAGARTPSQSCTWRKSSGDVCAFLAQPILLSFAFGEWPYYFLLTWSKHWFWILKLLRFFKVSWPVIRLAVLWCSPSGSCLFPWCTSKQRGTSNLAMDKMEATYF